MNLSSQDWLLLIFFAATWVAGWLYVLWWFRKTSHRHPPVIPENLRSHPVDRFDIHYIQKGSGPHVVLLHGIGANIFVWRFIMDALAKHFTVTAIDLPGFGHSTKIPEEKYGLDEQTERLNKFLDALNVKEAALVGSSMGGAIALWMASQYPERYKKVVAVAPAAGGPRLDAYIGIPSVPIADYFQWLVNRKTIELILHGIVAKKHNIHADSIHTYLGPYLRDRHSGKTFMKATEIMRDRRLPGELSKIENPVLILWGERDKLVPRRYLHRLEKVLPNKIFLSHPEAGHHPMEDTPEWVIENILNFLTLQKS